MFGLNSILASLDANSMALLLVQLLDKPGAMDGLRAGIVGLELEPAARQRLIDVADIIKTELTKNGQTIEHKRGPQNTIVSGVPIPFDLAG